ncbi:high mobility group B protein 6-like [Hibiscus syriacus]|uniref:High mobility group B protein 6-like n=1 Tax=Hibiscus syriacus TaxID=106335 RepID=A0A6A2ZWR9_HIBSY|nr:high mobility group B protein 6-like [Hibiscus syriacus]
MAQNSQSTLESIKKNQESLVDQIVAKLLGLQQASAVRGSPSEGETTSPTSQVQIEVPLTNRALVIINVEEDIVASVTMEAPYIEVDEEAVECSFRSLEFVNATFVAVGRTIHGPRISKLVWAQLLAQLPSEEKISSEEPGEEISKATGNELQWEPMTFPPLCHTFKSGGYVFETTLSDLEEDLEDLIVNAVITGNADEVVRSGICPLPPGFVPRRWSVEELPMVYKSLSESPDNNNVGTNDPDPEVDFESAIYLVEFDERDTEEDCNLPTELLRMVEREDKQIFPHKETIEILNIGTKEDQKEVKIGTTLSTEARRSLIDLLREYREVFAWSYQDMPGLDTDMVVHKLPIKPVQQKLRRMRPKMLLKIKEEVKKQFDAGFRKWQNTRTGNNYFSFMDGFSGYNQSKMYPKDMEKTTFVTMWGTFCYKVMPFGLKNVGATYQRAMVTLFHDMIHKEIEVYVDNMIIKAQTENQNFEHLRKLFQRLRKFQLRLNPRKCTFGVTSGKLLSYVVSRKCIEVDPDKVKAIQNLPLPRTQKENNPGSWDENCQITFEKVKEYLSNTPILMSPIPGKPMFLYISIFENSMGCVLGQHDESEIKERPIYYLSKKFTDCVVRYPPIEKTDGICFCLNSTLNEDLMALSLEETGTSTDSSWRMYLNGASNVLRHGIRVILISPEGSHYPFTSRLNFDCTNNMAEYEACVLGIRDALGKNVKTLRIYRDSTLVIYQLRGEWETKDTKLMEYRKLILDLLEEFDEVTFHYVPRDENQMADALATLAAAFKVGRESEMMLIDMQSYEYPAHCYQIEEVKNTKPWYYDILQYIKHRSNPEKATETDKRTIRRMTAGYVLDGEVLYKKSHNQVLLRCVDAEEAKLIVEEVHDGVCGEHANGHMMSRQIMGCGYFWSTLESDYINYARKFHKCQIYGDKINVPPHPLHVITSPWPFSLWGMDVIGQIHPKASNGHRFFLVAIDYFTKWVEVASYVSVTQSVICKFFKKEIICRYGLHERIITDNATNLNNRMMKASYSGKMTKTYKDWHEKLPFALFAYRTSVRTSMANPFSLAYGMEAVLPIEVRIPSLRVLTEFKIDDAEWVQSRYDQLNLIDEKRLKAIHHDQIYQKRMIQAHNKKVRPRIFREGGLVLKRILPVQKDFRGKWTSNWEGPYVVKKAFFGDLKNSRPGMKTSRFQSQDSRQILARVNFNFTVKDIGLKTTQVQLHNEGTTVCQQEISQFQSQFQLHIEGCWTRDNTSSTSKRRDGWVNFNFTSKDIGLETTSSTSQRRDDWLSTNNFPISEPISTSHRRMLDSGQHKFNFKTKGRLVINKQFPNFRVNFNFTTKDIGLKTTQVQLHNEKTAGSISTSHRRILDSRQHKLNFTVKGRLAVNKQFSSSKANFNFTVEDIGLGTLQPTWISTSRRMISNSHAQLHDEETIQRPLVKSFKLVFNFTKKDFVLRIFQF